MPSVLSNGVDPHAVFSHVKHAVAANVVILVVAGTEVFGDPTDHRRQAVQPFDSSLVTAGAGPLDRPMD